MRILTFGLLTAVIMAGCAERQEEAEKLGQEVMEQESTAVESTTAADFAPDSMAAEEPETDAGAVPEEGSTLPPTPSGEGHTVQVAACESYDYAQHLLDLYRRRGYQPYVVQYDQEGTTFYRVRIGSFETRAEAAALKAELMDKYSVEAWIGWKEG